MISEHKLIFLLTAATAIVCFGSSAEIFNYSDEDKINYADQVEEMAFDGDSANFMLTDYQFDGEFERRISFNGLTAKETTVNNSRSPLSLWQITNGNTLIEVIYSPHDDIMDCKIIHQTLVIKKFVTKFYNEIDKIKRRNFESMIDIPLHRNPITSNREFRNYLSNNEIPESYYLLDIDESVDDIFEIGNITYRQIDTILDVPDDIRSWLNFHQVQAECHRRKNEQNRILKEKNSSNDDVDQNYSKRQKRSLSNLLIAPNTKWCGRGQNADSYNDLGGSSRADKCCRKHDHCKANVKGMTTKWNLFNYRPYTISHCNCDISRRHRRDLSNLLRIPGTKWCGKGWTAKKYSDLGGYSRADRCCRQHDKSCPFWITGFKTKYGLHNWRINTLMHCKCDERFRTCLKMADTADANMVGKLFFNIVQTKCFVIKSEKICRKRSKNGKCEKKAMRKRAYLRDNRRF